MPPRFCAQCGSPITAGARFCSHCGASLHGGAAAASAPPVRWQLTPAGLGLAGFVLVAGLAIWAAILQPEPKRAGLGGGGGGGGGAPQATPGAMGKPAELPAEVKTFIDDLAKRADAAPDDAALWTRLGQVYYRAAQIDPAFYAKSLTAYDHVLAKEPKNVDALRGKANVFYDQNDHAQAIPLYLQVLAIAPDDANAKTDLATMYLYAGDPTKAIATYEEVVAKHPDFMQAHYNLAVTHAQMGHTDAALAAFAKARELTTEDTVRKQIDEMVARVKAGPAGMMGAGEQTASAPAGTTTGTLPPGHPPLDAKGTPAAAPGAGGMPPGHPPVAKDGAAAPAAASTATTPFQTDLEKRFRAAPIMGERIARFDWTGPGTGRVVIQGFPMAAMPPAVKEKFAGRLVEEAKQAAAANPPGGPVTLQLVDPDGSVMATVAP